MSKRFWISVVVMFVAAMACDFIIHGVLLGRDYAALTPKLFRPEAEARSFFPFMLLAHVIMAIGITWLYRGGRDARPWTGQGVRFGLALAFYAIIPTYLIYFAVQPTPAELLVKQIALETIKVVVLGLIVAAVNRDPLAAQREEDGADEDLSPIPR